MKNVVGPKIQQLRRNARPKVTQADLAARLQSLAIEIDQTALSRIEHGERQVTDVEIIAISQALEVKVEALFDGAELPDLPNHLEPEKAT